RPPPRPPAAPRAPPPEAVTVPTPVVTPTNASGGPVDETAVLPPVRMDKEPLQSSRTPADPAGPSADAEVTTELPQPSVPAGAADETAVLPPVRDHGPEEETAVLPPVRDDSPSDRVPPGFFRDERGGRAERGGARPDGADDRTRELPQLDEEGSPRRRPRPDWAEETPLDDLPTLADELLGPHRDEDDREGRDEGRGRGRRR
ncbi:dTMP kinase, partial [Streptomyces sp. NPDC002491]